MFNKDEIIGGNNYGTGSCMAKEWQRGLQG